MFNILEQKSKIVEKPNAFPLKFEGGDIEFKNVKYAYLKDENNKELLLDGLSLKINKGTHNAIVGPSGFGKSTLFNMIFRLLDPDEGEILIDNQNLKDVTLHSLRSKISIVP